MSAWSTMMHDAAPAALVLLGALPLDIYREIFARTEYATLRDACRLLNRALGKIAIQTLHARRYVPCAAGAPMQQVLDTGALLALVHVNWAREQVETHMLDVCTLPFGAFAVLLRTRQRSSFASVLLATFDARACLRRVQLLPLQQIAAQSDPTEIWPVLFREMRVHFMYVRGRHLYLLLLLDGRPLERYYLVRYTCGGVEPPLIRLAPRTLPRAVAQHGPARWTVLEPDMCAVAAVEPLRFALRCRGQRASDALDSAAADEYDQTVMLEMDGDLNVTRAVTLDAPCASNLARYEASAPWSGAYDDLSEQFTVDTHGRYVFVSQCVGTRPSVLLFEPRGGTLVQCVPLDGFERGPSITLIYATEPHVHVYALQPGLSAQVQLQSEHKTSVVTRSIRRDNRDESLLLEDGHVLTRLHVRRKQLVICKNALLPFAP